MKITKVILFILLILSTKLFAHKVAGIKLEAKKVEGDKIQINAYFQKSKRALIGNKIKLISMIDNRILYEDKLSSKGLITIIPNESYWIYLILKNNDVVIDGIAPLNGFEIEVIKEPKAFLYSLIISMIFLLLSLLFIYKRTKS